MLRETIARKSEPVWKYFGTRHGHTVIDSTHKLCCAMELYRLSHTPDLASHACTLPAVQDFDLDARLSSHYSRSHMTAVN